MPNGLVPDLTIDMSTAREVTIAPEDGFDLLPWIEAHFSQSGPNLAPPAGDDAARYNKLHGRLTLAIGAYVTFASTPVAESLARAYLRRHLRKVERALGEHPGDPYLFGERMTLPDLTLVPWLERADVLPRYFCAESLTDAYPNITAWLRALRARPAYAPLRLDLSLIHI